MSSGAALTLDDEQPPARAGAADDLIARFERLSFSWWHTRSRVVMGSATFLDAFDALSLAFVLPVLVGLWKISPAQVGLLISSSYVGQLAGALLFSRLAERYGRVPSAAAATAIMSVMSIACAFTGDFWALFACRMIQGIGVGGEMPVAAAYISELSRAKGRGRFFMLYEMIFPVGLMATGQIGAILVPELGWRAMLLIGGVPGLIVTVLLLRLPESPRWLIARGRLAEAEAVIRQAEAAAPAAEREEKPRIAPVPPPPPATLGVAPPRSRWRELVAPAYLKRSLVVWALWACAFFVANSLNNWLPTLYRTVYELPLKESLRAASMTNVCQVALLLVCAFLIDRIGRRNWMVAAFLACAALMAALGLFAAGSVASVIVLATLAYGVVGSANAVLYLYTPEVYPTRIRAIGTGLATSWLRLASAVGPWIVGLMVARGGVGSVFLMFSGVAVVGALAALLMIETRGKQLEHLST